VPAVTAIEAEDLHRAYRIRTGWLRPRREEITAVRGVSFQVERGELFGLLGPNGAGKTSTIKMLTTLLLPTRGSARILGCDVVKEPVAVRRQIGYVAGGDRGLYDRLSGLDNLRYFAELYGVPARDQRNRIGELLELMGLTGRERQRVEGYSRGMRQRLHIARGLLNDPAVLFLDEPTIGLDPVACRDLRRTIADIVAAGRTVLLTTHYMFEADELCDRIGVITKGELRAMGTPAELKRYAQDRIVLDVEVYGVDDSQVDILRRLPGVSGVTVEQRGQLQVITIQAPAGQTAPEDLLERVRRELSGLRLGGVTTREPSLEDAYVAIVSAAEQPADPREDPRPAEQLS
jgi:ABC-2 type transport system ATP-binding protein